MKTAVLLNISVEIMLFFLLRLFDEWKIQKNSICLKYKSFVNIIHFFTITFDQFNASLLNKSIYLS